MVTDSKCLSFNILIFVVTLTSLKSCAGKPQFGYPDNGDIASAANKELLLDDKSINSGDTPEYSSLNKRDWGNNFAAWGKKRWSNFPVWGKRSFADEELSAGDVAQPVSAVELNKRGSFDDPEAEGGYSEKRKWTGLATWGKRDDTQADKRKWSQFASWGKRATEPVEADKRKWSQFASWGKREDTTELGSSINDADKRKWSQFSSWGKRDDNTPEAKRKWSQFAPWGKRNYNSAGLRSRWAGFSRWGKRKWAGLPMWGKRSMDQEDAVLDSVVSKLLTFFDTNEDGVLDRAEIRNYIQTLMSLPPKPDEKEVPPA